MNKLFTILLIFISTQVFCQVGGMSISTAGTQPDPSAMLDVSSTLKGTLITRMTTVQRDAIASPAAGLFIYNTDCSVINYNAGTPQSPNWATVNASNVLVAGVSISANPIGAICAGSNVTFTATPANGINSPSYQWKVNGQNVGSNASTYTTSTLNNGDVVTCVLTTSEACVTGSPATSNPITVLVNIVPTITGTTPAAFCSGSAVTLSASANLGTINWYANPTGGSSLSSGASFTVSGLTSSTTYYVDATANGCTTSSRTAVAATFYPNGPIQAGPISGLKAVKENDTATYSITGLPNTATYSWTVSSGVITSGQGTTSILVTWGDTAAFTSISVTANNPCGSSPAQTINVGIQKYIFSYTGNTQTFTVPAGVTNVGLNVYGAQGDSPAGSSNNGGLGGNASGTLNVTPGQQLSVYVGGQPNTYLGGFNGGGNGYNNGTGGGGASDIRVGATDLASRVIVAGGGGGTTFSWTCNGGYGGGTTGGTGTSSNGSVFDGQGGTQNSGGAVSNEDCGGSSGSLGQGGTGSSCDNDGGGGGGGYYGGGGSDAGGAGGGSGYTDGVIGGAMQSGVQQGNGVVIITW